MDTRVDPIDWIPVDDREDEPPEENLEDGGGYFDGGYFDDDNALRLTQEQQAMMRDDPSWPLRSNVDTNVNPPPPPRTTTEMVARTEEAQVSQEEALKAVDKSFEAATYLEALARQVGVDTNIMPATVKANILKQGSKSWVNRVFFEWLNDKPAAAEFTPGDLALFQTMVGVKTSPEYKDCERRLRDHENNAVRFLRDAQANLQSLHQYRMKILTMEGLPGIDLSEEMKQIVKDGWYTYDAEKTKAMNDATRESGFVFTTPRVTLRHVNAAAGINHECDMGSYEVLYKPLASYIMVRKGNDNPVRGNSIHPHVSSNGDVCWGTADSTYATAMTRVKPAAAFLALRVILTTYNDASPFVRLTEFMAARNQAQQAAPAETSNAAFHWVNVGRAWIRDDDRSSHWEAHHDADSVEDDDGNNLDMCLFTIFSRSDDGDVYAVRLRNGLFEEIDSSYIHEWE